MFIYKQLTINNIILDDFPFDREISMAAYIIENEEILSLGDDFGEISIIDGEISLLSGGRIDILVEYGNEYLTIVELKLGEIDRKTISQLEKYLQEREQILKKDNIKDLFADSEPKWIGIIAGKTIDPEIALEIRKGKYFQDSIPIAALTINRFKSNDGQVYVITDKYAPEKVKGKDYSKYLFNGNEYRKGRLVLAVVKKYLEGNSKLSYKQLLEIFPDSLQGSLGVLRRIEEIKDQKRYFTKPEELLKTGDGKEIALCTQWGENKDPKKNNIKKFVDYSTKDLGFKIEKKD